MKKIKIILVVVFALAGISAMAQWSTNGTNVYNTNTGYVGIGTNSPTTLVEAVKNMTEPSFVIHNTGGNGGASFRMIDDMGAADWKFKATYSGGFKIRDQSSALDVITIEKAAMANALYIKAGGNIGIGTTNPSSALSVNGTITGSALSVTGTINSSELLVNGKITCKEILVTSTGWPDYVFEKEYKLLPLSEVETYIINNGHLPGIPSAIEIEKNGLSVGGINKQLMQKVEELTLYVIQLQKEIDTLKK